MSNDDKNSNKLFGNLKDELWRHINLYKRLGFCIIPLRPRSKVPLIPWKEFQTRKPTDEELEKWFRNKFVNVGIVCGKVSGNLFVIDFDGEEAFSKAFHNLERLLNSTLVVKTARGYHVYFRAPKPIKTTKIAEGVEIKGEGSYVVAPPSIHPSGARYEIISKVIKLKFIENVDEMISTLFEIFRDEKVFEEDLPLKLGRRVPYCIKLILEEGVDEGERNDRAFDLARYLYNKGKSPKEILNHLKSWNKKNRPPLPEKELEYVVNSVVKHRYKFGCGRLRKTKWCHEVCPYFKRALEAEQDDLLKLVSSELENNRKIISGPVHFDPELGVFYIIQLKPPYKSLKQLPVLTTSSFSKIAVIGEHNQAENLRTDGDDGCIPHLIFKKKSEEFIHDSKFARELLLLYVTSQKDPDAVRKFDSSIFDKMVAWYQYYVYFEEEMWYYVVVCWIVGTYLFPMFSYFPYLIFRGEKGSGKGTNSTILKKVCWNATEKFASPSEAAIFRLIEYTRPTLIIEEAHRILKNKFFGPVISAILEAGVEQDAAVPRCDERDPSKILKFSVFCPKVLTTREELEQEDKAITIIMTKKEDPIFAKRKTELERDNRWDKARTELVKFALARWKDVLEAYTNLQPTNKLTGRYFNLWAPILAICRVIFPHKFEEMLKFAEKQVEGKLLGSYEKENIVLQALSVHLDELQETEDTFKVRLKELMDWTEFGHWRPVKDALANLKLIKKEQQTREGKVYYLYKDRLLQILKERRILEEDEEGEERKDETIDHEVEEKIYEIVERAAGEAGIIYIQQKLKEEHGLDLLLHEIRSIARASPKLEVSERTVKVRRSK